MSKETVDVKKPYLTEQIITYLGNKRSLLKDINKQINIVKKELKKDLLVTADLFSGSGIVSRLLKEHSSYIVANDLEQYSADINACFLANRIEFDEEKYEESLKRINEKIKEKPILDGIVATNYAPKDTNNIAKGERCFYKRENAIYIDSFRHYINEEKNNNIKKFLLAELLTEASIHTNTCGVFKGFYKDSETGIGKYGGNGENALVRIMGDIDIKKPVLSDNQCEYRILKKDAVTLSKSLVPPNPYEEFDLVYLDPPYNQHPYGSNYFMLNVISQNELSGELSKVSGIPKDWHHSAFNKRSEALNSLEKIIKNTKTKYFLVSYNDEGFIEYKDMIEMLSKYGECRASSISYNAFRGSRNLSDRNLYTHEFLFLLRKENA